MFVGYGQEENTATDAEITKMSNLGEKMIADLKALKASGKMTPEQTVMYYEFLKLYNET